MRILIVRDKADTRPISEQIDQICERLTFTVGKVGYDNNYFIIEKLKNTLKGGVDYLSLKDT